MYDCNGDHTGGLGVTKNQRDGVKWMKMFDMIIMEGVFCVIRTWFGTFLWDHLLFWWYCLECDSLHMPTRVSTSIGESLMVDRVYRSYYCPLGWVVFLGILDYFRYYIFGVFLK